MGIIDAWVNVRLAGLPWQRHVVETLFKRTPEEVFKNFSAEEVIASMDAAGIEKAILGVNGDLPEKDVLRFAADRPERFALAAHIDPRRGMKAVRALTAIAKNHPVVAVRLMPSVINLAPDDRVYYPLYAKAIELAIPVCVTAGIPGPQLPARCQDPIHFDDVCLFFPELSIVMANGADPWWNVATRLLLKHPNLYLMTSACAPKYLPTELIDFMNTRGQDKIIFATDFPFLEMDRCVGEARQLDLREGVLDKYLHENARRVFFPPKGQP
jgi:predicted TIM-barrel fold metal-dependent hydrolase